MVNWSASVQSQSLARIERKYRLRKSGSRRAWIVLWHIIKTVGFEGGGKWNSGVSLKADTVQWFARELPAKKSIYHCCNRASRIGRSLLNVQHFVHQEKIQFKKMIRNAFYSQYQKRLKEYLLWWNFSFMILSGKQNDMVNCHIILRI